MATRIEDVFDKQQHASIFSRVIGQQVFWVFLAAVAAVVYLSLATDTFDTPRNLFNVGRNFAFVAIIGFGMTAVIASGGIDLSVGSVVVMSAMVMSVTMDAGHSLTLGIVLALLVSVGIGAFNGVLIAILGMPAFVVTLGMLSLARSLAMVLSGNKIMSNFGPDQAAMFALGGGAQEVPFPFLGTLPVPNPVFVMAALGIATGLAFRWTRWGQYVFAIGGNENAARLTGVPV
ncbi:MAG: ABC transporter permease, partial [Cucumibacter sp.]